LGSQRSAFSRSPAVIRPRCAKGHIGILPLASTSRRPSAGELCVAILAAYLTAGSIAYAALGLEGYARRLMDFRRGWAVMPLCPYALALVFLWCGLDTRRAGGRVVGFRRGWPAACERPTSGARRVCRLVQRGRTRLGPQVYCGAFSSWRMVIPRCQPF